MEVTHTEMYDCEALHNGVISLDNFDTMSVVQHVQINHVNMCNQLTTE